MIFSFEGAHEACHKIKVCTPHGRKVRSTAEEAHIRIIAVLKSILADDCTEIMTEKNELTAAVVVMNICENKDCIGNEKFVPAFFTDTSEEFELSLTAVTAEIVGIGVEAVVIQKFDESSVSVAVFDGTMNYHHTAEWLV